MRPKSSGSKPKSSAAAQSSASAYEIGAYYFPNYHADPRTSSWHGHRWTEWELLKQAKPRFPGHRQPRVPAWGYEDESDPAVMTRKAKVAAAHGLSHWIFDWYHYEGAPFLNGCLDRGFLGAGQLPVKFALMWANHDWFNIHPARADGRGSRLLDGKVSRASFVPLVRHVVEDYFTHHGYWCIDGAPYFSFYDLPNFVAGLGGAGPARAALEMFREEAARAGFPRIHLNLIHWQNPILETPGGLDLTPTAIRQFGFDSIGSYAWVHHFTSRTFPEADYLEALAQNEQHWATQREIQSIPYFPNVSMGWDASPRTTSTDAYENRGYPFMTAFRDSTPANFRRALQKAKAFVDAAKLPVKHVSINAWNEWTEGSYLEPDTVHGLAYLEAIRDIFAKRSKK